MALPIGNKYTSTVSGSTWKAVACQHCAAQFAYKVTVKAQGEGSSMMWLDNAGAKDRAQARALSALNDSLKTAVRPARCPGCDRYQTSMFRKLGEEKYNWTLWALPVGVGPAPFLFLASAFFPVFKFITIAFIVLGIGVTVIGQVAMRRYDPTTDARRMSNPPTAHREQIVTREEWEDLVARATEQGVPAKKIPSLSWPGSGARRLAHA